MKRDVAELNGILRPQGLARAIAGMYDSFTTARAPWIEERKETRNFIFATDNRKTMPEGSYPWRNTTVLPKLTQIRDNLHANYLDALFPNDRWLRWEAYTEDAALLEKRKAIETYISNKTREGGFRQEISKLLLDYIDDGNAFADVIWVNESHTDPETRETIAGYVGPRVIRISPMDLVINAASSTFENSAKITRVVVSIGDLKKAERELNLDSAIVAKAMERRSKLAGFKHQDWDKAEGLLIDGFGNLQEYYQQNNVELLKFEGDIHDGDTNTILENQIIWIMDRQDVVKQEVNPSWLGRSTKSHVAWRRRPDNLYGMGPLDNLIGMQYQINKLENSKADALDQFVLPPKVIRGDVDEFEWGPDAEIHIDADGGVDVIRPELTAIFAAQQEISLLEQRMEEYAGAPRQAMGIRTPGEKTAFEVQTLDNAAGRIFQNKINQFEIELLEPILNTMLELSRRNMDGADLIRVMDDDIGVEEFLTITKEDITAAGKLRAIGARHFAAKAQLTQNLVQMSNTPIWQEIAPHRSSKKLSKIVEGALDLERFELFSDNIAVAEQMETQQIVQEAQQQLAVEQEQSLETEDLQ